RHARVARPARAGHAARAHPYQQHEPDSRRGVCRTRGAHPSWHRSRVRRDGDRAVKGDAWSREEFEAKLQDQGSAYHIYHPFNVMLNNGGATREQIQGWVANRFYYQTCIPIKDAAILSNCPDRAVRRSWVQRILDHDGYGDEPGGIESWLRLAEAVGLARERVESLVDVLPGVRFAVDAYVNFARRAPWQE